MTGSGNLPPGPSLSPKDISKLVEIFTKLSQALKATEKPKRKKRKAAK